MNLKERQFNLIFPVLILLPFCLLGLFVFWKIRPYSVKEIYEKMWLITLPDTISLSEDHTQNSFDGENYRYTVFENKENEIIDLSFIRNAGETDDICRDVLKFYEKEGRCYVEKYESITTQSLRRHYPYQVMVGSVLSWRILRAPLC